MHRLIWPVMSLVLNEIEPIVVGLTCKARNDTCLTQELSLFLVDFHSILSPTESP